MAPFDKLREIKQALSYLSKRSQINGWLRSEFQHVWLFLTLDPHVLKIAPQSRQNQNEVNGNDGKKSPTQFLI